MSSDKKKKTKKPSNTSKLKSGSDSSSKSDKNNSKERKKYKPKRKPNSRRKKPRPEETKHLTNSLAVFGLPDPFAPKDDEDKKRGPPQPQSLRKHGEKELSELLADALSKSGHVDRGTHSFHTYPAAMHPDMAKLIISELPGVVHDPFCGGGTVLIEGRMANRPVSGSDLSEISQLITLAKLSSPHMATPLRSAARKIAAQAQLRIDVDVPEDVQEWYEPHVAQELGRIRDEIPKYDEHVQPLLKAVFSSIIIKSSYRKSDTSNKREVHHRPPGTTAILFHKKARELGRMLETMPEGDPHLFRLGDARLTLPPRPVDLILTSPPYPGVYDYLPLQQLRYSWLQFKHADRLSREVGSRRSFRSQGRTQALSDWITDTEKWIATQASQLNSGGHMLIVVGDGIVGGKLVDALYPTVEAMKKSGMDIVARASADRPDHARSAIRIEHLVMGTKK